MCLDPDFGGLPRQEAAVWPRSGLGSRRRSHCAAQQWLRPLAAPARRLGSLSGRSRAPSKEQQRRTMRAHSHCAAARRMKPYSAGRLLALWSKAHPQQPTWVLRMCGTATPRSTARAAVPGEHAAPVQRVRVWRTVAALLCTWLAAYVKGYDCEHGLEGSGSTRFCRLLSRQLQTWLKTRTPPPEMTLQQSVRQRRRYHPQVWPEQ